MIKEIKKDLFKEIDELLRKGESVVVVHCISSDCGMGAGIAKPLQKKYKIREGIRKNYGDGDLIWEGKGFSLFTNPEENCIICNLVTKEFYWGKPTYTTLSQALTSANPIIKDLEKVQNKKVKIVMPRIACGLDKLDWSRVREMIAVEFDKNEFEVTVCSL